MSQADERIVKTQKLGEEASSKGARMAAASLAGHPGIGTLQVVRGRDSEVLEVRGTWRAEHDDAAALERLRAAERAGEPVVYEGIVDDPENAERRAEVAVRLSSSGHYAYTDRADGDSVDPEDAPEHTVFNFVPLDEGAFT